MAHRGTRRRGGAGLDHPPHQWSDGTTHLRVDPVAFLARLAVLIPRPRINLVLYYGILAPRAPWRAAVVAPHEPVEYRQVVTEGMAVDGALRMVWTPERPGN